MSVRADRRRRGVAVVILLLLLPCAEQGQVLRPTQVAGSGAGTALVRQPASSDVHPRPPAAAPSPDPTPSSERAYVTIDRWAPANPPYLILAGGMYAVPELAVSRDIPPIIEPDMSADGRRACQTMVDDGLTFDRVPTSDWWEVPDTDEFYRECFLGSARARAAITGDERDLAAWVHAVDMTWDWRTLDDIERAMEVVADLAGSGDPDVLEVVARWTSGTVGLAGGWDPARVERLRQVGVWTAVDDAFLGLYEAQGAILRADLDVASDLMLAVGTALAPVCAWGGRTVRGGSGPPQSACGDVAQYLKYVARRGVALPWPDLQQQVDLATCLEPYLDHCPDDSLPHAEADRVGGRWNVLNGPPCLNGPLATCLDRVGAMPSDRITVVIVNMVIPWDRQADLWREEPTVPR